MAEGKSSIGFYIIVLLIGAVIGSILGEVIGAVIPKEPEIIHNIFVTGISYGIGPIPIDLKFFTFTIGFSLKLTLSSVIGIVIAAIIMKKV